MPRTLLCLATAKGLAVAESLPPGGDVGDRLAVCTFEETGVDRSHHDAIEAEAVRRRVPVVPLKRWRGEPLAVIRELGIDRVLCIGWRYLIPPAATEAVGGDVIVAHDSLLPRLRGFAPLPTALLLGHERVGVTFLRAAEAVDAGPVYWQRSVGVASRDTIADLIDKVAPLYVEGVAAALAGGFGEPVPQDEAEATFSLWRDGDDYALDFSLDAEALDRAVRALGPALRRRPRHPRRPAGGRPRGRSPARPRLRAPPARQGLEPGPRRKARRRLRPRAAADRRARGRRRRLAAPAHPPAATLRLTR